MIGSRRPSLPDPNPNRPEVHDDQAISLLLVGPMVRTFAEEWIMAGTERTLNSIVGFVVLLALCSYSIGARPVRVDRQSGRKSAGESSEPARRPDFLKAFVIDDRISVLRRAPSSQSEAIRRLRLGHVVFVVRGDKRAADSHFCRIAVSRRTRGWIHRSAIAVQSRAGEDRRLMRLIEGTHDGLVRITLCRMLIERFGRSPLVPRALLLIGEESDRAAESLSQRARRRIPEFAGSNAPLHDYYLNDPGLDRYSRLQVVFDFNDATSEYVYNGQAYRDVVKRYPKAEEAAIARQHLNRNREAAPPPH